MTKRIDQNKLYNDENKKIGLVGGTFDPPHSAHIYMAEVSKKQLGLDKVIFMPSGNPPHKNNINISDAKDRLEMIKLAIEESDNFYIDDYEVYSSNLSYTVDSIKRISKVLPENSELYFIIGADSLLYLDRWYDAQTLLDITNFVVIPREGYKKDDCENKIEQLKLEYNARITYINCKPIQLSSTSIRKSIVNDEYKNLSVNKKVIRYIKENRLYKNV